MSTSLKIRRPAKTAHTGNVVDMVLRSNSMDCAAVSFPLVGSIQTPSTKRSIN